MQNKITKKFPIIYNNNKWETLYNTDYKKYFSSINPASYIDLARKITKKHSTIFRNIYLQKSNWDLEDILQNWALSCAVFVSQVLYYFWLIKSPSTTVTSTKKKLKQLRKHEKFDQKTENIKIIPTWAILIRSNQKIGPRREFFTADEHIWFYIGEWKAISNAISNNSDKKKITTHNAIRNLPKNDHYDNIEISEYFYLPNIK